jgi:DNA recombination protein RmuC
MSHMTNLAVTAIVLLAICNIGLTVWLLRQLRRTAAPALQIDPILQNMTQARDRTERLVREEIARNRTEGGETSRMMREELVGSVKGLGETLATQIVQIAQLQKGQLDIFAAQLVALTQSNENKLEQVRETVEGRLTAIQSDNAAKLEAMRATVDEKLHATLETRLGESFKLVSERLEQVHKGLGEMQTLASGVGDLKKVLTNIKTRGNWGEVQLGNLLEQLFTPDQYASNVAVNPDSADRVEYAIKLPGRETDGTPMWLPIDAKFPQEDYQRLVEAAERGDAEQVAAFAAALESSISLEAKKIKAKYICPPHTTDFAMLFLPTEGLFAEVLRRPGLVDGLLHQHRVVLAGPTTLAAMLSSLQMGFRTLAIEKRSSEVWQVLGAVKTEFGKFGETLDRVHKKLQEASNTIERAQTRKRAVERQLKSVEVSPPEPLDVTFGEIGVPEEQMPEQELFDSAEIP